VAGSQWQGSRLEHPRHVVDAPGKVCRRWGGGEQPARRRSDGGGWLSWARKTPASACMPVRGRGR
jgi:hypothetical protein